MNYRRIEKYFLMINVYSLTTDIFSKRPLETYLYGKNQNMKRYMKRFSLYGIENDIINHWILIMVMRKRNLLRY